MKYIIILLLLLSNNIYAQSKLLKEGRISQKFYNEVINFEIINGKIIIPVVIEGKIYRFLFDTGAPNTLNSNVFQSSNNAGQINVSDANNKKEKLALTSVEIFKINNLEFEDYVFMQYDFSQNFVFNCLNLGGIIGSNSFVNSVVKIDYLNKRIYITDKIQNLSPTTKANMMKLRGKQKSPYFEITLVGKNRVYEELLFDTGYNGFYSQSNRAFSIFQHEHVLDSIKTKSAQLSISLFGSDIESDKSIFTIPKINLSSSTFLNVVAYSSNDNNSKIGTELLKYGNIILDFKRSKYYFEPHSDSINLYKPYPLFAPSYNNGKLIVGMIVNDALEKQITVGDEIISIDGNKIEMINCEVILNFAYPKEKFTVKNGEIEKEILIKNYQ